MSSRMNRSVAVPLPQAPTERLFVVIRRVLLCEFDERQAIRIVTLAVHDQMSRSQQLIGLGGAVLGIGVGLWGAERRRL